MKPIIAATIAATLCAGQVSALSCMQPDVVRTFQAAAQAEERYVILLGQFSFAPPPRRGVLNTDPQPVSVPAQFTGRYLGADGFIAAPTLDVTMTFTCAGPWCGSLNSGAQDMVAFVQQTPAGYTLEVGPCQGNVFNDDVVPQVEACMRGEACEEGALR